MKSRKIHLSALLLATLSGILSALAFPKFSLSFLGWISLIPLLYIIYQRKNLQAFFLGWIAGFSFYAVLLIWIPAVPQHYGGLSSGFSLLIYLLFTMFLGFFWAIFILFFSRIQQSFPKFSFFLFPLLWVSYEYTITHLLTGFPWGLLGYSQYRNLYLIQMSALLGVYGLSFILVFFQSMFVYAMKSRKRIPFFFALALMLVIHLGGLATLQHSAPKTNPVPAAVVQGNIRPETDFTQLTYAEILDLFHRHIDLSQQAYNQGSRLIIWPELSVPFCFTCPYSYYPQIVDSLSAFVQATGCTFLLGTYEINQVDGRTLYFNTASCLTPDLSLNFYYKMHLVPFGEYTPYKKVFSFISNFTHAIGELTPGSEYRLHEFNGAKFGTPICYEIIFPELARNFVKKGAEFLVTVTNDGWYGKSSAPYQHFSMAVLRAVENRRYLLRSATTGISGIIDPYGRILAQSELDTETYLPSDIYPIQDLTFYTKYGAAFPLLCLTLSGLFFILALTKKKNIDNERKRI